MTIKTLVVKHVKCRHCCHWFKLSIVLIAVQSELSLPTIYTCSKYSDQQEIFTAVLFASVIYVPEIRTLADELINKHYLTNIVSGFRLAETAHYTNLPLFAAVSYLLDNHVILNNTCDQRRSVTTQRVKSADDES